MRDGSGVIPRWTAEEINWPRRLVKGRVSLSCGRWISRSNGLTAASSICEVSRKRDWWIEPSPKRIAAALPRRSRVACTRLIEPNKVVPGFCVLVRPVTTLARTRSAPSMIRKARSCLGRAYRFRSTDKSVAILRKDDCALARCRKPWICGFVTSRKCSFDPLSCSEDADSVAYGAGDGRACGIRISARAIARIRRESSLTSSHHHDLKFRDRHPRVCLRHV